MADVVRAITTHIRHHQRVARATRAILPSPETRHEALDMTLEATHEALAIGADVLQFAPVIGLAEAARVLASIWDAVQMVDVSTLMLCRSR